MEIASSQYALSAYASGVSSSPAGSGESPAVSKTNEKSLKEPKISSSSQEAIDSKAEESQGKYEPLALSSSLSIRGVLAGTEGEAKTDLPPENSSESVQRPKEGESEGNSDATALTEEEQEQVEELKQRDLEVRQHEQAHLAAAGSLATGGAQYEFQTGPDGKQYAIGGHVNIDTSPGSNPQATIAKAKQIQRAATAPADPSPQDVKVAAKASQMLMEAQQKLSEDSSTSEGQNPAEKGEIDGGSEDSAASAFEGATAGDATFENIGSLDQTDSRITG